MPEIQPLVHFPLVRLGAASFCMMNKVGFKMMFTRSFLMSLCRRSCRIYTRPNSKEMRKPQVEGDHGRGPA